jgi:type IV secretion system protein VirD4
MMPDSMILHSSDYPVLGSLEPDAVTLGRLIEKPYGVTNKMRYGGNQHILVVGANGKGKGTRVLMPNLLQMRGNRSLVVIDPKGELAAVTAKFRREVSRVVIINPFNVVRSDFEHFDDLESVGFNPLASIDPASPSFNTQASRLADALVTIEGKDPHWSQSARALIAALLMYTVIEARDARKMPKMSRFRELLCQASSEGNERLDLPPVGIPALAMEMIKSSLAGLRNKAAQFTDWTNEVRSIASTARIQTEPFDDMEIAADLDKDGFDFHDLRKEPTTVYLILPPDMMDRHSKWLRLVLTSAIQGVLRVRKAREPRVLFMLDEFYGLGHLEIISTVWAQVRGYGITIMPVLQDLGQLKKLYPDLWETFIGMAGAVIYFAPNDLTTAEYMSRRAGDTTREATSESESFSTSTSTTTGSNSGYSSGGMNSGSNNGTTTSNNFSSSSNSTPVKVPLIAHHHLFGLHPGSVMITLDGLSHVIPAFAPAYYQIRQCLERARDNPYYTG